MGIVANANFAQMIDFAAGFMGFDPAGNDGRKDHKYGYWPWQIEGWPLPTGRVFPYTPVEGSKEAPKEAPEGGAAKPAEPK